MATKRSSSNTRHASGATAAKPDAAGVAHASKPNDLPTKREQP